MAVKYEPQEMFFVNAPTPAPTFAPRLKFLVSARFQWR